MSLRESYNKLNSLAEELILNGTIQSILTWDFETYMPSKGVELRAKQLGYIAKIIHEKIIDPIIGELIKVIKEHPDYNTLTDVEKRNVYLVKREYDKEIRVPTELAAEIAAQATKTIQIWKQAKKEKKYSLYKPELSKILELVKKRAKYINPDLEPFDVLLDEFEPGMTSDIITKLFDELKTGLIPIIEKCVASPNQPDLSIIKRTCPKSIQKELSKDIARIVTYDLERGSIDETEHPFTTGYYDDVRITTHYYENDFANSFYSIMHEAGHALYEQNLNRDFLYKPVGAYCSLGIHESQSRFIENILGRSPEFWEYYLTSFKTITGDIFSDVETHSLVHAINQVIPSKIRVTADEVTYCLHIIIRFEIERDLLTGKISVDELPSIWNRKYKEYLGVVIEDDSEGVMQDTHWAGGAFGYFPTYALGNIYNAQMLNTMLKDIPNYYELIKSGNISPIINWLINNVHKPANMYNPPELMKKITGEEVNSKYFIDYLEKKYSKLYGF